MIIKILFFSFLVVSQLFIFAQQSWIRINQLGYQNQSIKIGIMVSKENLNIEKFDLIDAQTNKLVFTFNSVKAYGAYTSFVSSFRLDFTEYQKSGEYYLSAKGIKSPIFLINNNVYDGTADFILKYMRQQRCGYNPFLKDSCHINDGFIVDNPQNDSAYINVKGGWHDASDYLQYLATSANATYQMLFAYKMNPEIFKDNYDKNGDPGNNGIPDILDEAKWGLDWMVKMNPEYGVMYNQIADDRDHAGYRLPTDDSVNYGKELQRPIYLVTGKQQGLAKHKNRSTGVSSTAGKFASAFALGSEVLKEYYPEFSEIIFKKSIDAYKYGKTDLGVTQTASNKSPYFYEEDNYVDDMELAAIQLFHNTGEKEFLNDAIYWGNIEPITPWMGLDTARHYQWYPFVNLGHYLLALEEQNKDKHQFVFYLKKGLNKIYLQGKENAFLFGIPFIWCSNNLVAATLTQIRLYEDLTNDKMFSEMEASLRDWLFGCNPWGSSMIVGLPEYGDYPSDPHSSFWVLNQFQTFGGLVDGPVYTTIFNRLLGLHLTKEDEYVEFQSDFVVYHDDRGDYSTNEPTMDGTASLSYYLSALEKNGRIAEQNKNLTINNGAITRRDTTKKEIYLMFSGGDFNDGCQFILDVLEERNIKAHFFFTGDFYRNKQNNKIINKCLTDGHYLGAHSDKHLLYASWEDRNQMLISNEEFINDLNNNYIEMAKFGIKKEEALYFLPPYEWYNAKIAEWTKEQGLELISFSHGTRSNADYTIPSMGKAYVNSEEIYNSILNFENNSENGLNGFHLFFHVGADQDRKDKFYYKLELLIEELEKRGYTFKLFNNFN